MSVYVYWGSDARTILLLRDNGSPDIIMLCLMVLLMTSFI